jgi:hypothetical protein
MARFRTFDDTLGIALPATLKDYVEDGLGKARVSLGAKPARTFANNDLAGLGFAVRLIGSGSLVNSTVHRGTWHGNTTTTSDEIGFLGPNALTAADDWSLYCRVVVDLTSTTPEFWFGLKDSGSFSDENNVIAWRVLGGGSNFEGVCDNGGTETTRNSGTAEGTTERTLGLEVSAGGTIVRFIFDGVQVGADVTDNIPSSTSMEMVCGLLSDSGNDGNMHVSAIEGFRDA